MLLKTLQKKTTLLLACFDGQSEMIRTMMSKDRVVATKHTQYLLIGTFWTCGAVFLVIPALLEGQ